MKKILISLLLFITFLNANGLEQNIFQQIDNNKEVTEKKKRYSDLISFLENSNNGEYFFYLATIYTNGIQDKDSFGETVNKDTKKAILFFNKSIEKGYYLSSAVLGSFYLYHEDFIIQKDNLKKSEYFLKLSIKNGIYDSTTILSDLYFNYLNKPKEAVLFLSQGASHGISTAQLALASLYFYGYESKTYTLKKNEYLSSKYLTDACTNKNKTEKVKEVCSSKIVEQI